MRQRSTTDTQVKSLKVASFKSREPSEVKNSSWGNLLATGEAHEVDMGYIPNSHLTGCRHVASALRTRKEVCMMNKFSALAAGLVASLAVATLGTSAGAASVNNQAQAAPASAAASAPTYKWVTVLSLLGGEKRDQVATKDKIRGISYPNSVVIDRSYSNINFLAVRTEGRCKAFKAKVGISDREGVVGYETSLKVTDPIDKVRLYPTKRFRYGAAAVPVKFSLENAFRTRFRTEQFPNYPEDNLLILGNAKMLCHS